MADKKPAKKKAPKKEDAPRRSVIRLAINGTLEDVLRASVPPPPKPQK